MEDFKFRLAITKVTLSFLADNLETKGSDPLH